MARVPTNISERIFNISRWHGVNEAAEGEAALKLGEAAEMRNFRVTSGGALKKRPGSRNVAGLLAEYVPQVRAGSRRLLMTDVGLSPEYEMRPRMMADDVGHVSPAGDPVTVDSENAGEYAGFYYAREGQCWQLSDCVSRAGTGTEDIVGGKATAGALGVICSGSEVWTKDGETTTQGERTLDVYAQGTVGAGGPGVRGDVSTQPTPAGNSPGWSTQNVGGYVLRNGQLWRYYGARVDSYGPSYTWRKYRCNVSSYGYSYYTQSGWSSTGTGIAHYKELITSGSSSYSFNSSNGTFTGTGSRSLYAGDSGTVYDAVGSDYAYRTTATRLDATSSRYDTAMCTAQGPYTGYNTSYSRGEALGTVVVREGAYPEADRGYSYVTTFSSGENYTVMRSGNDYFCYAREAGAEPVRYERAWSFQGYPLEVSANTVEWYFNETYSAPNEGVDPVVRGLWSGYVKGREVLCAACGGFLWELRLEDGAWSKIPCGDMDTSRDVYMFGFDDKLYILNGVKYQVWDGDTLQEVEGYRPLVSVGVAPTGGGTLLEPINRLTAGRRCWFSPDGTAKVFQLPETDIAAVEWVKDLTQPAVSPAERVADGEDEPRRAISEANRPEGAALGPEMEPNQRLKATEGSLKQSDSSDDEEPVSIEDDESMEGPEIMDDLVASQSQDVATSVASSPAPAAELPSYTVDIAAGTVTFTEAPAKGVNTLEIAWSAKEDYRSQVCAMRFAELYNGAQDSRVFLYGDGSNRALYSGLDHEGRPRADYFPDLYEAEIGESNTPITAMIRHYNKLMAFKTDSAWSIGYDTITLADGSVTAGFYVAPVNRSIGNCAMGQAQLVQNRPRTLDGRSVMEWKATSSSGITGDQRNAERVSQRVDASIRTFDLTRARTFYDKFSHEYYVIGEDGTAIVQNLDVDAWYVYTGLDVTCMMNYRDELYYGTRDGYLRHFSDEYFSDNGEAIDAWWESGAMSFNEDFRRKYSAMVWVGIKPEDNGYLEVTAQTDRKSDFAVYDVATFDAGAVPEMERIKIKAKKFTYYKLILSNNTADRTCTVVSADMRVRGTGYVR